MSRETVRVYERSDAGVTVEIYVYKAETKEYISSGVKQMGKLKEIPFVVFYTGFQSPFGFPSSVTSWSVKPPSAFV